MKPKIFLQYDTEKEALRAAKELKEYHYYLAVIASTYNGVKRFYIENDPPMLRVALNEFCIVEYENGQVL